MKTLILLILFFGILFGVVGVGALTLWNNMAGVDIGIHGMAALVGGGILTFLVGAGLMALVFISNRSGHDQRVSDGDGVEPRRKP